MTIIRHQLLVTCYLFGIIHTISSSILFVSGEGAEIRPRQAEEPGAAPPATGPREHGQAAPPGQLREDAHPDPAGAPQEDQVTDIRGEGGEEEGDAAPEADSVR